MKCRLPCLGVTLGCSVRERGTQQEIWRSNTKPGWVILFEEYEKMKCVTLVSPHPVDGSHLIKLWHNEWRCMSVLLLSSAAPPTEENHSQVGLRGSLGLPGSHPNQSLSSKANLVKFCQFFPSPQLAKSFSLPLNSDLAPSLR